jgi:putative flippase GtrA
LNNKIAIGKQFVAYTGAGAIGTAAHYLTLILLVELLRVPPLFASSAGAIAGALVNYVLNYKFIFKSDKSHAEAMTKFLIVAAAGFCINFLLMWLLVNKLLVNYLIAQVITTGVVLVTNYTANRIWTFKRNN